jgi:integrase
MTRLNSSSAKSASQYPRSLPVNEWLEADRRAWEDACRPGSRLKPGGAANYLAQVSRDDFARRYGAFVGFLQRHGRLERDVAAAAQVTLPNVEAYIADLTARVRSVTVYNGIYKLRRAAQLLAPTVDFSWLTEIEKDLALVMEPRSKFDRLVFTERLVEAGLILVAEAQEFANNDLARARGVRNGLMVALLALCPIRLKNFAALEIGQTFKEIYGRWWIALPRMSTKSRRADERPVPAFLNQCIDAYLKESRPVLLGSRPATNALWISSTTGRAMTTKNMGTLISRITLATLGVDVSPHLFRTAAASTAATYGGNTPHLASAVLHHTDPRVTEKHYNRASSLSASKVYAEIIKLPARLTAILRHYSMTSAQPYPSLPRAALPFRLQHRPFNRIVGRRAACPVRAAFGRLVYGPKEGDSR